MVASTVLYPMLVCGSLISPIRCKRVPVLKRNQIFSTAECDNECIEI